MQALARPTVRHTPLAPARRSRWAACSLAAMLAMTVSSVGARDVIKLEGAEAKAELQALQSQLKVAPTDARVNKEAGILLHQMSRRVPDKGNVELAESYLKTANKADPSDAETLAWLGSVQTMKALFDTDPGKQTFHVKVGSRAMDSAVQQAPDNLIVRLIRAANSMELPPFLKRTRFAVEDYTRYLALCEQRNCPATDVSDARAGLAAAQKRTADAL